MDDTKMIGYHMRDSMVGIFNQIFGVQETSSFLQTSSLFEQKLIKGRQRSVINKISFLNFNFIRGSFTPKLVEEYCSLIKRLKTNFKNVIDSEIVIEMF